MKLSMPPTKTEQMPLQSDHDIVRMRQTVRAWAIEAGMSLVDQTKIVTAASELGRNTWVHGGGGSVKLEIVERDHRRGVRLTFEDRGPGIPNIDLALRDGYTTANGMGLGLGGAKRLSNEFEIDSRPGEGTRITITRWKI
jgi:serine/threonine-protein kinase RsbT